MSNNIDQDAIDKVIKERNSDLSTILIRFDIKLKLSSSIDEVIKKNILGKNEMARDNLKIQF